jgi:plastocyanin
MRLSILIFAMLLIGAIVGCSSAPTPTAVPPPTVAPTVISKPAPSSSSAAPSSSSAASSATSSSATVQVEADDDFFRPEKITITVGTTVTWVNLGHKTHTVTFGNMFDTDIKPGETFSFTFNEPGTIQYYCVTHSTSDTEGMVGTITVQAK